MLPASSPLKCVSPSDVYMLLKSSDFILHDVDAAKLFDDCDCPPDTDLPRHELELVLRKWYPVDRSRELRCFVRRETLIGTSIDKDAVYDMLTPPRNLTTRSKLLRILERARDSNKSCGGGYEILARKYQGQMGNDRREL